MLYVIEAPELWSTLWACRHRGTKVWSSGGVKARCRRADVKAWRFGALEARRRYVDERVLEVWMSYSESCKCSDGES